MQKVFELKLIVTGKSLLLNCEYWKISLCYVKINLLILQAWLKDVLHFLIVANDALFMIS